MAALRLARGFTGRSMILKFEGCYHGHGDSLLVKAGSGVATLGLPDSPGVPSDLAKLTLTCRFNDLASVESMFAQYGKQIAAVILEPVVGNMGCVPPQPGFLEGLRSLTSACGSLLIFDEVMTGFRIAYGGAQERYGVQPDLTTLGKVIGGGLPVGAYGGRRDIMDHVAPVGPVYQAGTLSGNPLAVTAGITTLKILKRSGTYSALNKSRKAQRWAAPGSAACRCPGLRKSGGIDVHPLLYRTTPLSWTGQRQSSRTPNPSQPSSGECSKTACTSPPASLKPVSSRPLTRTPTWNRQSWPPERPSPKRRSEALMRDGFRAKRAFCTARTVL